MTLKEIKFEDIRKGDVVRTVRKFDNGYVSTTEGKATHQDALGDDWYHESISYCVASLKYAMKTEDKFYLIERIEPKDHLVISDRFSAGHDIETGILLTETEAKARAEKWNSRTTTGRKYRAVKVNL